MRRFCLFMLIITSFLTPAAALEMDPPQVPAEVSEVFPEKTESFGQDLLELMKNILLQADSSLAEAQKTCICLIAAVLIVSILQTFEGPVKTASGIAGTLAIATILLKNTKVMFGLAADTIAKIGDYGKLLLPVMTSAMAAQGQVTSAAAIYTGSVFFISLLSGLIAECLLPMVYFFLALTTASSATGEGILKNLAGMTKGLIGWMLKTALILFTSYMSITGIVSGTTDAAALKAAKVTISTVVPVVGGILSDASESVLVSAGLVKNAAGTYGLLALLAIFLGPFFRIGVQYLTLKLTAAICSIFGSKQMSELTADFSSGLGLLLGMTGAVCTMYLISTVCFMKGVS